MSRKLSGLLIVLGALLLCRGGVCDDKPAADEGKTADQQIEVNHDALISGQNEEIRIKAAGLLLTNQSPDARKILLEILKQSENPAARTAVCKALAVASSEKNNIQDREDFLEPLLAIIEKCPPKEAGPAGNALLIFDYEQVGKKLGEIIADNSKPVQARINAINTLKLQPDKKAIFRLLRVLDVCEDQQVITAAEDALRSIGIPTGQNQQEREDIIEAINRKGTAEFLRDREMTRRQRELITELQKQKLEMVTRYLGAMDKVYELTRDESARADILIKHLADPEPEVKLWALDKIEQLRLSSGSNKSNLQTSLGPALVQLIADGNAQVRLKTAKLLSMMSGVPCAEELLGQLEREQDEQVRLELFTALGEACHYAIKTNSGVKVSPQVQKSTLDWAVRFLNEQNPEKANKGAEVVKKLLEQDGLADEEVKKYLELLVERYEREKAGSDTTLRGSLLGVMAGLCAETSHCREEASKMFQEHFQQALAAESELVRTAGFEGLINANKTKALHAFRRDLVNDKSGKIADKGVELAGQVGGNEDLVWLARKVESKQSGKQAWSVMLKIFGRSELDVLNEWLTSLNSRLEENKITNGQMISFLEIAERKAESENKTDILLTVRRELATLYARENNYERAATCLAYLLENAKPDEKNTIRAELLEVYLDSRNMKSAAKVIENCMLAGQLADENKVASAVDEFLEEPPDSTALQNLLKELSQIKAPQDRPAWAKKLAEWMQNKRETTKQNGDEKKQPDNSKT